MSPVIKLFEFWLEPFLSLINIKRHKKPQKPIEKSKKHNSLLISEYILIGRVPQLCEYWCILPFSKSAFFVHWTPFEPLEPKWDLFVIDAQKIDLPVIVRKIAKIAF